MSARGVELLRRGALELGLALSEEQLGKFAVFAAELQKWNKKINLTAITTEAEIVVKHFIDSLSLLKIVARRGSLLDVGSGGGFPGIPLKIFAPELVIVSVDAVAKKINFQRHVARLLGLSGFTAHHGRVEELDVAVGGSFDWIVSRAFSEITHFAGTALPLLRDGGKIVAMKGKGGREEAGSVRDELTRMGLGIAQIIEFPLPLTGDGRSLVVLEKLPR